MHNWGLEKQTKWEYLRYVFDWQRNSLQLGENKNLDWNQMWEFFNQLGEEGWEMVNTIPISHSTSGHASGDTNRLLFVFKKEK